MIPGLHQRLQQADRTAGVGGRLLEHGPSERLFDNPRTPELKRFLSRLLEWSM